MPPWIRLASLSYARPYGMFEHGARAGTPISFWDFTRKGTLITIVIAAPYLWLRYFVLR